MHLSWCPRTWYFAWCSLTTTPASLEPASPTLLIHPILQAKRAPLSTLSPQPTAPTEPKAGTRETNKSMCPSKSSVAVFVREQCLPPVFVLFVQADFNTSVCTFVWMCMYVPLVCLSLHLMKHFSLDWFYNCRHVKLAAHCGSFRPRPLLPAVNWC